MCDGNPPQHRPLVDFLLTDAHQRTHATLPEPARQIAESLLHQLLGATLYWLIEVHRLYGRPSPDFTPEPLTKPST